MRYVTTRGKGGFYGALVLEDAPEQALCWARPRRPLLTITRLYTHPLRRGLGWGSSMLREAQDVARAARADVWIYVHPFGNTQGKDGRRLHRLGMRGLEEFYGAHGFQVVARAPDLEMLWRCGNT